MFGKQNRQHCPNNNLKLCIKTEPVTAGADATVYVWILGQIHVYKSQTCTVASTPAVTCRLGFLCGESDYFWDSACGISVSQGPI